MQQIDALASMSSSMSHGSRRREPPPRASLELIQVSPAKAEAHPGIFEGSFVHLGSFFFKFLDDTLVNSSELVDQMTCGCRLARVDMANNNDVQVGLLLPHAGECPQKGTSGWQKTSSKSIRCSCRPSTACILQILATRKREKVYVMLGPVWPCPRAYALCVRADRCTVDCDEPDQVCAMTCTSGIAECPLMHSCTHGS